MSYIGKNRLLKNLKRHDQDFATKHDYLLAKKIIEEEPDASDYIYQIRWERDVAIEQLKELGYKFGEKIK